MDMLYTFLWEVLDLLKHILLCLIYSIMIIVGIIYLNTLNSIQMTTFFQMAFSNAFSWWKFPNFFFWIALNFVSWGQTENIYLRSGNGLVPNSWQDII